MLHGYLHVISIITIIWHSEVVARSLVGTDWELRSNVHILTSWVDFQVNVQFLSLNGATIDTQWGRWQFKVENFGSVMYGQFCEHFCSGDEFTRPRGRGTFRAKFSGCRGRMSRSNLRSCPRWGWSINKITPFGPGTTLPRETLWHNYVRYTDGSRSFDTGISSRSWPRALHFGRRSTILIQPRPSGGWWGHPPRLDGGCRNRPHLAEPRPRRWHLWPWDGPQDT